MTRTVKVLKRLRAAVGYDELDMLRHALGCLDSLASFGDIGHFAQVVEVLRDEFAKKRENRVSAYKALEIAAGLLPRPARHAVQLTLAACYKAVHDRGGVANDSAAVRGIKGRTEQLL